jgi:hypothetical protein
LPANQEPWASAALVDLFRKPEFTLSFEPVFKVMPMFATPFLESAERSQRDGILRVTSCFAGSNGWEGDRWLRFICWGGWGCANRFLH